MKTSIFVASLLGLLVLPKPGYTEPSDCDFSPSPSALTQQGISAGDFFKTAAGTVAIGQECESSDNSCKYNFVISGCEKINFPVDRFKDRTISIIINTSLNCEDSGCHFEDGYVAAALVARTTNKTTYYQWPEVQMTRNEGWLPYKGAKGLEREFKEALQHSEQEKVQRFFKLQTGSGKLNDFQNEVAPFFHAKSSDKGYLSWDSKDLFGQSLTNLPECTSHKDNTFCIVNAYLERFAETPLGRPTKAVRVYTGLGNANDINSIIVRTRSPIESGLYNNSFTIDLVPKIPLPPAKPLLERLLEKI